MVYVDEIDAGPTVAESHWTKCLRVTGKTSDIVIMVKVSKFIIFVCNYAI